MALLNKYSVSAGLLALMGGLYSLLDGESPTPEKHKTTYSLTKTDTSSNLQTKELIKKDKLPPQNLTSTEEPEEELQKFTQCEDIEQEGDNHTCTDMYTYYKSDSPNDIINKMKFEKINDENTLKDCLKNSFSRLNASQYVVGDDQKSRIYGSILLNQNPYYNTYQEAFKKAGYTSDIDFHFTQQKESDGDVFTLGFYASVSNDLSFSGFIGSKFNLYAPTNDTNDIKSTYTLYTRDISEYTLNKEEINLTTPLIKDFMDTMMIDVMGAFTSCNHPNYDLTQAQSELYNIRNITDSPHP